MLDIVCRLALGVVILIWCGVTTVVGGDVALNCVRTEFEGE